MKKPLTKINIDGEEFNMPQRRKKLILSLIKEFSSEPNKEQQSLSTKEAFRGFYKGKSVGAGHLKAARRRENLSQKELSEKTGISISNISKYENRTLEISENIAKRFSKALNTDHRLFLKK
ncbi:MAG: helix-turn-helix transcriptional regulator [Bdellovibrionaceae bacterium]|nr:helix-turn-helix transcriptional regulator [Pseudobdellovibrionaceae bacterium]